MHTHTHTQNIGYKDTKCEKDSEAKHLRLSNNISVKPLPQFFIFNINEFFFRNCTV